MRLAKHVLVPGSRYIENHFYQEVNLYCNYLCPIYITDLER